MEDEEAICTVRPALQDCLMETENNVPSCDASRSFLACMKDLSRRNQEYCTILFLVRRDWRSLPVLSEQYVGLGLF